MNDIFECRSNKDKIVVSMKALIVGRFQPLHKGHLHMIRKAMERYDEIIIIIGSINKHDFNNPLTYEERVRIFRACGIKCKIYGVPDVYDDKKWVESIFKVAGDFDVVISGSDWVKRCFNGVKPVVDPDFLKPKLYHGTVIRHRILKGESWEELVPECTLRILKELNFERRVKELVK